MANRTAIKMTKSKLILILSVSLFILIGLIFFYSPAKAGTTITVTDSWTWADLETAIEETYKNQTVNFSINRKTPLLAKSQITIPANTNVTLSCVNSAHTMYDTDISRSKEYHGHFFKIMSKASLNVACCLSGGAENTDGLLLYEYNKETKTTTRVTDENDLKEYVTRLGNVNYYYSPVNYQYYGYPLISVKGGTLNVNEDAVLKYNYNPYSETNKNDFNNGIYSYNTREIINKYYETIDDRTFLMAYYNLPCDYDAETNEPTGTGGAAISNDEGIVTVTNAQIYGCSSDDGPAVLSESDDRKSVILNSTRIYKNVARQSGGGIHFVSLVKNPATLHQLIINDCSFFYNRAHTSGGAIITGYGATVNVNRSLIYNNYAGTHGGGLLVNAGPSVDTEQISGGKAILSDVKIYNNKAEGNAGALGASATASTWNHLTLNNCEIYNNRSLGTYTPSEGSGNTGYGGGIYTGVNCTVAILDGTVIRDNISSGGIAKANGEERPSGGRGGGIYISGGNATSVIGDSTIKTNTAFSLTHNDKDYPSAGGGIVVAGKLNIANADINNNAAQNGGGLYAGSSADVTMQGTSRIYENTAITNGGGISSAGKLTVKNGKIHSNTAVNGGGICVAGSSSTLTFTAGEITENTAENGGGIDVNNSGNATVSGGSIYSNTANKGGGVLIQNKSVFSLKTNSIYSNIAQLGSGIMLYNSNCTFNMSEAACVGDTNRDGKADTDDIYLKESSYISVPSDFTSSSTDNVATTSTMAIRAIVVPETTGTGRVIAKYTADINAKGSSALYWNTNTPEMNQQYFCVKDKILRSGDQGASENQDNINANDIFISERYNISFDMNPPALNTESVTHTIADKEYVFDDLKNNKVHTPFHKYWNEKISFKVGKATTSSDEIMEEWNTDINGTGDSIPKNETVTLPAEENKDYILYAQWQVKIEIDYNGNGATKGDNFTDKGVSMTDTTYTLNSGETDDGSPVFERIEKDSETGKDKLFALTGWSFNKTDKVCRFKKSEKITIETLKTNAVIIDGRLNFVTTMYAVWDQYPTIKAVDRWFTLTEAQNGKITLAELLSTARATDGEVGKVTDFYDKDEETNELIITDKEEFTIIDFNEGDFEAFTTSGEATVTYKAVDAYGNEAYKTVTVHIIDDEAQIQDEETHFTRFISPKYYKDINGDFVEPRYGGLKESSQWRTNAEYNALLTSTLSNTKNGITKKWDTVIETWNWSIEEIKLGKSFVASHGLGNTHNPDALTEFYNQFGPNN